MDPKGALQRLQAAMLEGREGRRQSMSQTDVLVDNLAADVQLRAGRLGLAPRMHFAVGAAPAGSLFAEAFEVEGCRVLAVSVGLTGFVHVLTKIVASAAGVRVKGDDIAFDFEAQSVERVLGGSPRIDDAYCQLMRATLDGDPHQAEPWEQQGAASLFAGLLRDAAEMFAVAGLIAMEMLEPRDAPVVEGEGLARHVQYSARDRISADAIALRLVLEAVPPGVAACGIDVFLTGLMLIEALTQQQVAPSARERRGVVRALLERELPEATGMARQASQVLEQLWARNSARILPP